jgi:hypothetical protein
MIRGIVIPKHEHERFLALSNPSDLLDLSRTYSVFLGLGRQNALDYPRQRAGYGRCDIQLLDENWNVAETIGNEDLEPVV